MSESYEPRPQQCFNPINVAIALETVPNHPENLQIDFKTRMEEIEELYKLYSLETRVGSYAVTHYVADTTGPNQFPHIG